MLLWIRIRFRIKKSILQRFGKQMQTYRCFTLDETGLIARREDIAALDDDSALEEGWRRVATHQNDRFQATYGLEIWLGLTLVFTTRDHVPMKSAA
jgi:hypothetical protein